MGISARHYIFAADGALKRVPHRIASALWPRQDSIPEFAGTTQKAAEVVIENDERKPVRILDVIGSFWTFDDEGFLDQDALFSKMDDYMSVAFGHESKRQGRVVDLVPEIKKRRLNEKHRWPVTKEDLDRIAADLWPGINGPTEDVKAVEGKEPKRQVVSSSAKYAITEIGSEITNIQLRLGRLTEHDLKGLAFEADRTASFEDEALWKGVAVEARRLQVIQAAHRTGRGEWYAVIEAMKIEKDFIARHVATAYERCPTKAKAIEASQRLMMEKADWMGPDIRIEVGIYSALEWEPDM